MKRHLEESELDQVQAENDRLKDKIKLYILERTYLQKRRESDESERKLSMERFKQKLAKVENEKRQLTLEYQRLRRGLGQCGDLWLLPSYDFFNGESELKYNSTVQARSVNYRNRGTSSRIKIEPRVVLDKKLLNRRKKKLRDYSQEYPSPKDPGFKQELVLTALRAIGGKGTLDDVDKWVRKHHRQYYGDAFKLNRRVLSRALSRQADSGVFDVERRTKKRRWNIYRIPSMFPSKCVDQSKPSPPISVTKNKPTKKAQDAPLQRVPLTTVSNHTKKASPMWTTSLIVTPNDKQPPSASIVQRPPESLVYTPVLNVGITPSISEPMSEEVKPSLENLPPLIAERSAQDASPQSQVV